MKPKAYVVKLFKAAEAQGVVKKYAKYGVVLARLAKKGETVRTVINGVQETTNTAREGDVVVKNPTGELYIVSVQKFTQRYKPIKALTDKFSKAKALGVCYAFQYRGESFKFEAPWGESMLIEDGDFLAQSEKGNYDDIYRIEKEAFKRTYRLQAKG